MTVRWREGDPDSDTEPSPHNLPSLAPIVLTVSSNTWLSLVKTEAWRPLIGCYMLMYFACKTPLCSWAKAGCRSFRVKYKSGANIGGKPLACHHVIVLTDGGLWLVRSWSRDPYTGLWLAGVPWPGSVIIHHLSAGSSGLGSLIRLHLGWHCTMGEEGDLHCTMEKEGNVHCTMEEMWKLNCTMEEEGDLHCTMEGDIYDEYFIFYYLKGHLCMQRLVVTRHLK